MKTLIHHSKAERFDVFDGEATLVCRGCCWRCKEDFFYFAESARDTWISFNLLFSILRRLKTKSSNEAPRPELQRVVLLTVGKPGCPLALGWVCELNRAGDGFAMIWLTLQFSTLCVSLFLFLIVVFLSKRVHYVIGDQCQLNIWNSRSWLSSLNLLYAMEVLLILTTTLRNHPAKSTFSPRRC